MQQTQEINPKQRQIRVSRAHADELQKIELRIQDVDDVEIDVRVLNKLRRQMKRQR